MGKPLSYEERMQRCIDLHICVDEQDSWLMTAFSWTLTNEGYVATTIRLNGRNRTVLLHHYIVGRPLVGVVDHIDRDPTNNTRANLRYVDRSGNYLNSDRSDTAYHITETRYGRYQVQLTRNRVKRHIGMFDTIEEAEHARDAELESKDSHEGGHAPTSV